MKLFDRATSYKTAANAERKLANVLGSQLDKTHWLIAVNTAGRFVPVVQSNGINASLCHVGICVIG